MRNNKLRLADLMPNAWFYKLRDMNKSRTSHTIKKKLPYPTQIPANSFKHMPQPVALETLYNFTSTNDSPSKKKPKRKTIYRPSPKQVTPSVSDDFTCILEPQTVVRVHSSCFQDTFLESPPSGFDYVDSSDRYSYDIQSFDDKLDSYSIIEETSLKTEKVAEFDVISEPITLPPILTKPTKQLMIRTPPASPCMENKINSSSADSPPENPNIRPKKTTKTNTNPPTTRKSVSRSRRLKIKNRKMESCGTRKSDEKKACNCFYSDSFAMVKASFDPEKDFRDSMKEMIVENNIQASRELEELLACYLSLNSSQYHDLIIKAFEQIWFTMPISTYLH